jgi:hypothetical protein
MGSDESTDSSAEGMFPPHLVNGPVYITRRPVSTSMATVFCPWIRHSSDSLVLTWMVCQLTVSALFADYPLCASCNLWNVFSAWLGSFESGMRFRSGLASGPTEPAALVTGEIPWTSWLTGRQSPVLAPRPRKGSCDQAISRM